MSSQADGINSEIYLSYAYTTATLMIFLNGAFLRPNVDYTEGVPANGTVEFVSNPNGVLVAAYLYAGTRPTPPIPFDFLLAQVFDVDPLFCYGGSLVLEVFR